MKKTILSFKTVMPILDSYGDNFKKEEIEGKTIRATLDFLGWGKSKNLFLLFSTNDKKFKTSVFHPLYATRDKSFSFRDEELIGEEFELKMKISKSYYLDLEFAKLIKENERSTSPF
ncbi:hypothetical protein CRV08_08590 [Halarcobacter ebronensis]|uniref:Uncharacterized protein n=1 Tax=Halarcobacter ebronensis TaxID=1462615 RepID=A0A4V1LRI3_9BACT|nr:hypothetical protein [Halarcobacter ebronensis]RXJ68298.1 hypothetical protein CRV08_08590 [Halarcobacter ebronensis]